MEAEKSFSRAVRFVALANLGYFFVELIVAVTIGSVALMADAVDFLEDASLNFLILLALGLSLKARAKVGYALAVLVLFPGLATLWMAWTKFNSMVAPASFSLTLTGLGAFWVNLTCAIVLARHKQHGGSLGKAAFLSARNDVFANIAIVIAGLATMYSNSAWPDLIVGLSIAIVNADATREIWAAARKEHLEARA